MFYFKFILIFFAIAVIYFGMTWFEKSYQDQVLIDLAMDSPIDTSALNKIKIQQDWSLELDNKSSEILQQQPQQQAEQDQNQACPPKPEALIVDSTKAPDTDSTGPIRIKAPTLASTDGRPLLIEGSGFIPGEQVRIELVIDWTSTSPSFKDKKSIQCKMVTASEYGNFTATLDLPKTPARTDGQGKYSIIGMESRQEQTRLASFKSLGIGFSYSQ